MADESRITIRMKKALKALERESKGLPPDTRTDARASGHISREDSDKQLLRGLIGDLEQLMGKADPVGQDWLREAIAYAHGELRKPTPSMNSQDILMAEDLQTRVERRIAQIGPATPQPTRRRTTQPTTSPQTSGQHAAPPTSMPPKLPTPDPVTGRVSARAQELAGQLDAGLASPMPPKLPNPDLVTGKVGGVDRSAVQQRLQDKGMSPEQAAAATPKKLLSQQEIEALMAELTVEPDEPSPAARMAGLAAPMPPPLPTPDPKTGKTRRTRVSSKAVPETDPKPRSRRARAYSPEETARLAASDLAGEAAYQSASTTGKYVSPLSPEYWEDGPDADSPVLPAGATESRVEMPEPLPTPDPETGKVPIISPEEAATAVTRKRKPRAAKIPESLPERPLSKDEIEETAAALEDDSMSAEDVMDALLAADMHPAMLGGAGGGRGKGRSTRSGGGSGGGGRRGRGDKLPPWLAEIRRVVDTQWLEKLETPLETGELPDDVRREVVGVLNNYSQQISARMGDPRMRQFRGQMRSMRTEMMEQMKTLYGQSSTLGSATNDTFFPYADLRREVAEMAGGGIVMPSARRELQQRVNAAQVETMLNREMPRSVRGGVNAELAGLGRVLTNKVQVFRPMAGAPESLLGETSPEMVGVHAQMMGARGQIMEGMTDVAQRNLTQQVELMRRAVQLERDRTQAAGKMTLELKQQYNEMSRNLNITERMAKNQLTTITPRGAFQETLLGNGPTMGGAISRIGLEMGPTGMGGFLRDVGPAIDAYGVRGLIGRGIQGAGAAAGVRFAGTAMGQAIANRVGAGAGAIGKLIGVGGQAGGTGAGMAATAASAAPSMGAMWAATAGGGGAAATTTAAGGGAAMAMGAAGSMIATGITTGIVGAITGLFASTMAHLPAATEHSRSMEQLYRSGGGVGPAGTRILGSNVGERGTFYNTPNEFNHLAGPNLGFSRDESIGLLSALARGGGSRGLSGSPEDVIRRVRPVGEFARYMGVDIGEAGEAFGAIERTRNRNQPQNNQQIGVALAHAIRDANMGGRESEVLGAYTQGLGSLMARSPNVTDAQRYSMLATQQMFNQTGIAGFSGQAGAQMLGNMDAAMQNKNSNAAYLQTGNLMRNNPGMGFLTARRVRSRGITGDARNLEGLTTQVQGMRAMYDDESAALLLEQQYGLTPEQAYTVTQSVGANELNPDKLKAILAKNGEGSIADQAIGLGGQQGREVTNLARGEDIVASANKLHDSFENLASSLSPVISGFNNLGANFLQSGYTTNNAAPVPTNPAGAPPTPTGPSGPTPGTGVAVPTAGGGATPVGMVGGAMAAFNSPLGAFISGMLPGPLGAAAGLARGAARALSPGTAHAAEMPSSGTGASIRGRGAVGASGIERVAQVAGWTCSAATLAAIFNAQSSTVKLTAEQVADAVGRTYINPNVGLASWQEVPNLVAMLNKRYGLENGLEAHSIGSADALMNAVNNGEPVMMSINPTTANSQWNGLRGYEDRAGNWIADPSNSSGQATVQHVIGIPEQLPNGNYRVTDSARTNVSEMTPDQLRQTFRGAGFAYSMGGFQRPQSTSGGRGPVASSGSPDFSNEQSQVQSVYRSARAQGMTHDQAMILATISRHEDNQRNLQRGTLFGWHWVEGVPLEEKSDVPDDGGWLRRFPSLDAAVETVGRNMFNPNNPIPAYARAAQAANAGNIGGFFENMAPLYGGNGQASGYTSIYDRIKDMVGDEEPSGAVPTSLRGTGMMRLSSLSSREGPMQLGADAQEAQRHLTVLVRFEPLTVTLNGNGDSQSIAGNPYVADQYWGIDSEGSVNSNAMAG